MSDDRLIRPKDVARLGAAVLLVGSIGAALQLTFECRSGSIIGAALFAAWLLSQWPFARMRTQLRRALPRRRRHVFADYFRN